MVEQVRVVELLVKMPLTAAVLVVVAEIEDCHQMVLSIKDIMGELGMTRVKPQQAVAEVLAEMA
jgi:hypothetical protein